MYTIDQSCGTEESSLSCRPDLSSEPHHGAIKRSMELITPLISLSSKYQYTSVSSLNPKPKVFQLQANSSSLYVYGPDRGNRKNFYLFPFLIQSINSIISHHTSPQTIHLQSSGTKNIPGDVGRDRQSFLYHSSKMLCCSSASAGNGTQSRMHARIGYLLESQPGQEASTTPEREDPWSHHGVHETWSQKGGGWTTARLYYSSCLGVKKTLDPVPRTT